MLWAGLPVIHQEYQDSLINRQFVRHKFRENHWKESLTSGLACPKKIRVYVTQMSTEEQRYLQISE